jgi:hypothetical protein
MATTNLLQCDGCGQLASSEHIAKRLERLEWTTRYRPVHIGTLLLGAAAPTNDSDFVYATDGALCGRAKPLLAAANLSQEGKSAEAALAEFQRAGFLVTYVLECGVDSYAEDPAAIQALLAARLSSLAARVRRSLKPKRLVPISQLLGPLLPDLEKLNLGCPIVLDGNKPFALDRGQGSEAIDASVGRLRQALTAASALAR